MQRNLLLALATALVCDAATFRTEEIQADWGVIYALQIVDMNGDRRPDIAAINGTQVVWFENPTWKKHVALDGVTQKDNVAFGVHDIDGDGKPDIALGASWQPTNTSGGGTLQWIRNDGSAAWPLTPITEEPTLHRMRWGDVDGNRRRQLIVVPLHGRGTKGPAWEGPGARVLVLRPPQDPVRQPWPVEVADDTLHIVHNFIVTDFDNDGRDEILTASKEGVHVLKRAPAGTWTKTKLGEGAPGEIKLGRVDKQRVLATVEPWHGNSVVIYEEPPRAHAGGLWPRRVIEDQLAGAHALGWGDFDGDSSDELAVGWRDKKFGIAMYKRGKDGQWTRLMLVDDGGMATEDLVVGDLNGDGKPEIVAGGRATHNVRIYWNTGQ